MAWTGESKKTLLSLDAEIQDLRLTMVEALDPTLELSEVRAILAGALGWEGPTIGHQQYGGQK